MKKTHLLAMVMALLLSSLAYGLDFNFDNGTFQGWTELTVPNPTQTEGARNWALLPGAWGTIHQGAGAVGFNLVGGTQDSGHPTLLLRSPEFKLNGAGDLTAWLRGGHGYGANCTGKLVANLPAQAFDNPGDPIFPSFLGIALRNVNSGVYDLAGTKSDGGDAWQQVTFSAAQLAALDQGAFYTLDLIDARQGGWGWVNMDTVSIPGVIARPYNPSPADGAIKVQSGAASWTAPGYTPTDYKVYLSQDPNTLNVNLKATVTATQADLGAFPADLGFLKTWYWRVDTTDPNNGTPVVHKGKVWSFTTLGATPVITQEPPAVRFAEIGGTVAITVEAFSPSGEVLSYAWYQGATMVGGQATLTIDAVAADDLTQYYCRVSAASGSVDSRLVELREKKLLAHWPLDSLEAIGSVVADSPATVQVGEPQVVAGIAGNALYFDGNAGLHTSLTETGTYFDVMNEFCTVSCWVKTDNKDNWLPFVSKQGEWEGWQLRRQSFAPGAGLACFTTRGMGNDDAPATTFNVMDDQWHHIVGTYDGAAKRIFVDGILDSEVATSGKISASASPIGIALRVSNGNPEAYFRGALDDVRLYNHALSKTEVADLYSAVRPLCVTPIAGDVNGDCVVDLLDVAQIAADWMTCTRYPACAAIE